MNIDQFRASHKRFALDDNSRALLEYMQAAISPSGPAPDDAPPAPPMAFLIRPHDIAIHLYQGPAGLAAIIEGPSGYGPFPGGRAPSLSEAENYLFGELIAK